MNTHEVANDHQTPDQTPPERDWQTLYAAERKRSRILGAATVAASLIAVGSVAWGFTANDNGGAAGPGRMGGPGVTNQFDPPSNGGAGGAGLPGGPRQDLASSLFSSDGAVNDEALQQFLSTLPGGADNLQHFLTTAVADGALTSDQAEQLVASSGRVSGSGTSSPSDVTPGTATADEDI